MCKVNIAAIGRRISPHGRSAARGISGVRFRLLRFNSSNWVEAEDPLCFSFRLTEPIYEA